MNTNKFESNSDVLIAHISQIQNITDFQDGQNFNFNVKSLCIPNSKSKIKYFIEKVFKRMIDILAGLVGLIILIPLTLIICIINRLSGDKDSVFYFQERIGKDGKLFKMPKYRSMIPNADSVLEEYLNNNPNAKEEFRIYKKLKDDPRITKAGHFLRKTSLDEMPQLFCLLIGDMSLVGPRPYLPKEKGDMGLYYPNIIKVKPGITGLWQTSGRSNTTFDERLDFDLRYIKSLSIKTDIKILISTAVNVLKKDGAI